MAAPSPSSGDAEGEGEAGVPISGMNGHAYSSETEGEDCGAAGDGPDEAPKRADSVDGEDVFEVEQILDVKTEEGNVLYKVRWKGYSSDDDTWEPEVHLQDCKEVLLEFRNRLAEKSRASRRETQSEMTPSTSGPAQVSLTPQSQSSLASPGPCADSAAGIAENHQRGSQTSCQLRGRPPPPSKEE